VCAGPHSMRRERHLPAVPGSAIAAIGFALGVLLALVLLRDAPPALASALHRHAVVETAMLAGCALALAAALFLDASVHRQNNWVRELLGAFLDHIPDSVYFKDTQSRFVLISRSMAKHFGMRDPSQAVGRTDHHFFSAEHADMALADEQQILRTGNPVVGLEEKETWPDGHENWVLTTKVPLRDPRGRIVGTMGISHDITDRRRAEAQILHMAMHDALTGLPNRVYLKDFLGRAVRNGQATKSGVAVLLLDLDNFKEVNDSMGHHAGDQLLEAVSNRLKGCLRESDFVARLGGDEFVVVLPSVSGENNARQIAALVLAAISTPFCIQEQQLRVGASIGVAQFPLNGRTPEDLLRAADTAMYEAKAQGRGQCRFSTQPSTGARYLASA